MRLIDADALFLPDENSDNVLILGGRRGGGKTVALAIELLKNKVKNAPTINPDDCRPHGRWVHDRYENCTEQFEIVKCSNCGDTAYAIAFFVKYGNYCPHCGARMDLEGTA